MTARNIKGDIKIHTGDGHIEGHNFDGSLDADTGDGNLRIDGRFDTLALKTGDGSIEAQVGNGSKWPNSWNLHSGDGHITVRLPGDSERESGRPHRRWQHHAGCADSSFRLAEPFIRARKIECRRRDARNQLRRRIHSHRKIVATRFSSPARTVFPVRRLPTVRKV